MTAGLKDRALDKVERRRAELADATLRTLAEQGYARTSLRDIAARSPYSLGVLHYYFHDKVDLITHGVRAYKAHCVTRYDDVVATATSADELAEGFLERMLATLRDEAELHRLWYDVRGQALFEPSFREDVAAIDASLERMVERVVRRYAELAGRDLLLPSATLYAAVDGLFQQALLRRLSGDEEAGPHLRASLVALLGRVVA